MELNAFNATLGVEQRFYFSTGGFTTGPAAVTPWGDPRPNVYYESRLIQPGLMRRDVFSQGTTGGAATIGYGVVEMVNLGDLDYLVDYGFDGRVIRILAGDDSATIDQFSVVFRGTMEQPEFTWKTLTIRLRDRMAELDVPCFLNLYQGTNALPLGVEGTPNDIKGQTKPLIFGRVRGVTPPQVNSSKLIYQVNDGAIDSVDAVYDAGLQLTADVPYVDLNDMMTNAPSPGTYRVLNSGGYVRLGSSPVNPVTMDLTDGGLTTAQVITAIATTVAHILPTDVSAADATALDLIAPAVVGIWCTGSSPIKQHLDEVAASLGCWYGFDRLGVLRMGQLNAPTGTPTVTFTDREIIDLERTATADTDKGVPTYQVSINHTKNYTVMTTGVAGAVADAWKTWIGAEFRTSVVSDPTVKTTHLLSPVLSFDTLLTFEGDAIAEASRRLGLYKVRRDRLTLKANLNTDQVINIDLNNTVMVQVSRFGYSAGKLFQVLGLQPDYQSGTVDLTLWG